MPCSTSPYVYEDASYLYITTTIKVPKKGTLVGWFESQLAVPSYRPARLPVTDHLVPRTAGQPLALWFTLAKIYGRFYPEFNA